MNNEKTGNLIRQLRKEQGLTQLELANRLSITDRAVSKWERGLCAPDIGLLEPLAEALGTTVMALITGEPEAPVALEPVLEYSAAEIAQKTRILRFRMVALILAVTVLLTFPLVNWLRGDGFVLDCIPAWICAEQAANALENYDEAAILRHLGNAQGMHAALSMLDAQGISIRSADADFSRTRLEDGLLLVEVELLVTCDGLQYLLSCPGTYRAGKVELMHVSVSDGPEWITRLSNALSTYDPG